MCLIFQVQHHFDDQSQLISVSWQQPSLNLGKEGSIILINQTWFKSSFSNIIWNLNIKTAVNKSINFTGSCHRYDHKSYTNYQSNVNIIISGDKIIFTIISINRTIQKLNCKPDWASSNMIQRHNISLPRILFQAISLTNIFSLQNIDRSNELQF